MAEKQEWTMVSDLVGRISLQVSGGTLGKEDYIPETKGFIIQVTYANQADKMHAALNSTRIAVQNTIRTFYRKNKRFPFKPEVVQAVDGKGEFTLPVTVHMDRLEAQAKAGELDRDDKIRLARMAGVSEEIIAAMFPPVVVAAPVAAEAAAPESTTSDQGNDDDDKSEDDADGMKYDEEELAKLSVSRLRVLAQKEELEGYDELSKEELIEELSAIEK